ncbi:hypothetical protein I350_01774 [Cryptococcus amylolentus CBS 6273]|nr:hypothetical protein I350_01774 [Cryptococcus amylolentus CBS 6273]
MPPPSSAFSSLPMIPSNMKLPIVTSFTLLLTLVFLTSTTTVISAPIEIVKPTYNNRIIFIRHAEKGFTPEDGLGSDERLPPPPPRYGWLGWLWNHPPWGPPGGPRGGKGKRKFPSGLSAIGKERAQFLRTLFGNESDYDFGLIFAAPLDGDKKETERTYATVAPLAGDLGLEVYIDCANAEASCVKKKVEEFAATSDKDILISWKHRDLNVIATALGAPNAKNHYPDDRYDIIWIMHGGAIVEKRSQHCPVIDDGRVDEGDPDLVVEKPRRSILSWVWAAWTAQRQLVIQDSAFSG